MYVYICIQIENDEHFEIVLINTSKLDCVYSSFDAIRCNAMPIERIDESTFLLVYIIVNSLVTQMHLVNRFYFIPRTEIDEY